MTAILEHTSGLAFQTFDIMLDYDDVITPWADPVHAQCEADGITGGNMYSSWHMWQDYGCPKEAWEDSVIRATTNGLYTDTDPFPHAVNTINNLLWRGHRIHIVTARGFMQNGDQIRQWTRDALAKHGIGHTTLTFAKDKVEAMEALETVFDFAIDDGVHNYENLDKAGVPVWLHSQPHNVSYQAERRIDSLWEFGQMVHSSAGMVGA